MHPITVTTEVFQLAEGPLWDGDRSRVLWVDIAEGQVFEGALDGTRLTVTRRHDFDGMVGAVRFAADGSLLVAALDRLVHIRVDDIREVGRRIVPDGRRRRLNDGSTDPAGRFLVGTLSLSGPSETEELVRLESGGELTRLDADLALSNGLAWSVDGRLMYNVDTMRHRVFVREYDPATGEVGDRRTHIDTGTDLPDGMAIDAADHLWIAFWGRGEIRRHAPDGTTVDRLAVPAPHTTSVAFCGEDLRTLVITTASAELDEAGREAFPDAGRLFAVRTEVPGVPAAPWRPTPL